MRGRSIIISALGIWLLLGAAAYAQGISSPPATYWGDGISYNSTTNDVIPGDEHGAIGRTYIVLHSNDEFAFIERSSLVSGQNPTPTPIDDSTFWGDTCPRLL